MKSRVPTFSKIFNLFFVSLIFYHLLFSLAQADQTLLQLSTEASEISSGAAKIYRDAIKEEGDGENIDLKQVISLYSWAQKQKEEAWKAHTKVIQKASEILSQNSYDSEAFSKKEEHEREKRLLDDTLDEIAQKLLALNERNKKPSSQKELGMEPSIQGYVDNLFRGKYDLDQSPSDLFFNGLLQKPNSDRLIQEYFTSIRTHCVSEVNFIFAPLLTGKLKRVKSVLAQNASKAPIEFYRYFLVPSFSSEDKKLMDFISEIRGIDKLDKLQYLSEKWDYFPNAKNALKNEARFPLNEEEVTNVMEQLKTVFSNKILLLKIKQCITDTEDSSKHNRNCEPLLNRTIEKLFTKVNQLSGSSVFNSSYHEETPQEKVIKKGQDQAKGALSGLFIAAIRTYPHFLDTKPRFQRTLSFASSLDKTSDQFVYSIAKDMSREKKKIFISGFEADKRKGSLIEELILQSSESGDSVFDVEPFLNITLIPKIEKQGFSKESYHALKFIYGVTQETLHPFTNTIYNERPGLERIMKKNPKDTSEKEVALLESNLISIPFKWSFINIENRVIKTYMMAMDARTKKKFPAAIIEKELNCENPEQCGEAQYKIIPWSTSSLPEVTKYFFGNIWDQIEID